MRVHARRGGHLEMKKIETSSLIDLHDYFYLTAQTGREGEFSGGWCEELLECGDADGAS